MAALQKTSPASPVRILLLSLALAVATLSLGACKREAPASGETATADKAESDKGGKEGGKDKKADEAIPVEVATVGRRAIEAHYSGTASLEAPNEAHVVAKTSGVLLSVVAEEGDIVKAGQVLARIDPEKTRLEARRMEAALRKLEAEYKRSQELFARKLLAADANERIRYDLDTARAAFDLAKLELSYTNIVAPIDGVIAQRMVKTGNLVQLNAQLFKIVDIARLEAVLNVPERELATMKAGMPAAMQVDAAPGRRFEGRIARVSPVVDAGTGTFRVTAEFRDETRTLKPGMFGRIGVVYDQREGVLTVARAALIEGQDSAAVFLVRDSKAVHVPVQLGYVNGTFAEVRSGLEEGDLVVTVGKVTLRDGVTVDVVNAAKDGGPEALAASAAGEGSVAQ